MKQSSIEWVANQLEKLIPSGNQLAIGAILEQAKVMHKEELLDTWEDSRIEYMGDDYIGKTKSFDDYYNETFNTK
jgi:hypothetical protein